MKIHYLVTSLETGGAEFAIPNIVKTLQSLGHEVSVIACEPRDMGAAIRLSEAGLSYTLLSRRRRLLPVILASYLKQVSKNRPDVIWTSLSWGNKVGQWAGRLTGIPVISFKHSASVRRYTYRMRNLSKLWVGDSQTVVQFLREKMHIPADQVMAWPLFQSDPAALQAQKWDGRAVLQLGSVGRLHEVKNYAGLLDAVSFFLLSHPEMKSLIHLTILGDGPERAALEKKIRQLNLENVVTLPGFSANVGQFLSGLHAYIQTSRYEGMCLAVHEAMNAGLPVISTPVGEIRDAVQEGRTGYVLDGDMTQAFNRIMEHIFVHPDELSLYGQQAHSYVLQKFSHEQYQLAATKIIGKLYSMLNTGASPLSKLPV